MLCVESNPADEGLVLMPFKGRMDNCRNWTMAFGGYVFIVKTDKRLCSLDAKTDLRLPLGAGPDVIAIGFSSLNYVGAQTIQALRATRNKHGDPWKRSA